MPEVPMCLTVCSGCLRHRLAIVVLSGGNGVWVDDECQRDQPGAGRRIRCDQFEPRWQRARIRKTPVPTPGLQAAGERVSILRPASPPD